MQDEIALKILDILEMFDSRITSLETSLDDVDGHDFMSWGSDKQLIDEVRQLIDNKTL